MDTAPSTRASPPLPPPTSARRFGGALILSAVVHACLLVLVATFMVRLPLQPPPIPVRILESAPPPPPLGEPGGAAAPSAPLIPAEPVVAPQPVAPPKPVRPARVRRPAPPVHARAPAAAPAPETAAPPGVPDGSAAGVEGGVPGGQAGGIVGGHGDHPIPADQLSSPPVVLARTMPVYPPLARARGLEGLVVLEVVVDRSGRVEGDSVRVIESVPQLDDAAITALLRWRFQPGRNAAGEAVRVLLQVPVRFQLR